MQGQGAIYMLPLRHTARLHCSQHGTKPQNYHTEGSLGGPPDSRRRRASTVSGVVWAKAPSRTSANDQLHSGEETIRLQYSCQALLKQWQIEKNENWEFTPKCPFPPFPFLWLLLGWLRHSFKHPLQIPRTLHAFLGLTTNCLGSITTCWFRCHPGLTCFKMGSRFKTHQPYVYITHIQYIYIYIQESSDLSNWTFQILAFSECQNLTMTFCERTMAHQETVQRFRPPIAHPWQVKVLKYAVPLCAKAP